MPDRPPMMCKPVWLPPHLHYAAALAAIEHNQANAPPFPVHPDYLAAMTGKTHAPGTVRTVGFMEHCPTDLRDKILELANRWRTPRDPTWPGANIRYVYTANVFDADTRITREGDQFNSFVGRDTDFVEKHVHTMMLGGITMAMSLAEMLRLVPHEFGHDMGFPHEQQRPDMVAGFDEQGTIAEYQEKYGWPEALTRQQILMALPAGTFTGTVLSDPSSIMCYEFSARCRKDRQPVLGGHDINMNDYIFAASKYTGWTPDGSVVTPPVPPVVIPPALGDGATPLALGGTAAVALISGFGQPARFAITLPSNGTLKLALRSEGQSWWAGFMPWRIVFRSIKGRETEVSLRGGQGDLGIDAGSYTFDVYFPSLWQASGITAQAWEVSPGMLAVAMEPVVAKVAN